MPSPEPVDDPSDPRLADYADLNDPQRRRRLEAARGFLVAESPHVVRHLVQSGRPVRSVLVTPQQYEGLVDVLAELDAPVYVASEAVLRRVVGFDLHRGAVAAADRWPLPSVADVVRGARRIAVLEHVNDHENLGVLFRSAAALGIDAVLLDPTCSDPLYRRTVRVSIGQVLTLPWTRVDGLDVVRRAGFSLVACTPARDAQPLETVAWPERVALLFGEEGYGLSDAWLEAADTRVRIVMRNGVDSLNVATAASIVFYACVSSPTT